MTTAAVADKTTTDTGDKDKTTTTTTDKPADKTTDKPADTSTTDTTTKTGDQAADIPKAPDKYTLKLPENTRLDAALVAQIEARARKLNLPNEAAQTMVDELHADAETRAQAWLDTATADKTYGGEKLAESQQLAKSVIDRVRPAGHPMREAFNTFLNQTGAGNRIEVLAFLADLGKLMAEDDPAGKGAGGKGSGSGRKSAEELFYGKT